MFERARSWIRGYLPRFRAPLPAGPDYGPGNAPGQGEGVLARLRAEGNPWPGPEMARKSLPGEDLAEERFRSGPASTVFPWFGPWQWDGSVETTQMRLAYRNMSSDPNCSAAVKGLIYAVASQDLRILPPNRKKKRDQKIASFVRWNLEEKLFEGVAGLVWNILSGGLVDGYSMNYKVYDCQSGGRYAGLWPVRELKAADTNNDVVLQTDSYRNIVGVLGLRFNAGIEFSPSEFLIYRHCPNYNSPIGTSSFRCVYKRWWFLQSVLALRGIAAEKTAIPFIWGRYKTPSQQTQLASLLAKVKSQNWAAVPEGVLLEVLNIAGSSESMFKSFCDDMREDIFLGIQHATLQALTGGAGEQRGSSDVHKRQTDLVRWYLSRGIECVLNDEQNGLVRDIVDLNFAGVKEYPRAVLTAVDKAELKLDLDLYKGLSELGLELSKQEIYDRFGVTPPEEKGDILKPKQPGGAGGPGGGLAAALGGGGKPPAQAPAPMREGRGDRWMSRDVVRQLAA